MAALEVVLEVHQGTIAWTCSPGESSCPVLPPAHVPIPFFVRMLMFVSKASGSWFRLKVTFIFPPPTWPGPIWVRFTPWSQHIFTNIWASAKEKGMSRLGEELISYPLQRCYKPCALQASLLCKSQATNGWSRCFTVLTCAYRTIALLKFLTNLVL